VLSAFLLGGQVVHRLPDPQGTRRGLPMSALRRGPFASIRAPRTWAPWRCHVLTATQDW